MKQNAEVESAFAREAQAQGMEVRRTLPDGRVVVALGSQELTISLENLSRDLARDEDSGALQRFVKTIRESMEDLPPWPKAKRGVRFSAEAASHEFGDTIREPVTDEIVRVLVYLDDDESRIRWLTPQDLETWGIDVPEANRAADAGMAALLEQAKLVVEPVQKYSLGYLDAATPLKASLIFSPNLKARVSPKLGWPIYAVVPTRDFAYLFPKRDHELISLVGPVVVEEFRERGYPITTEVLEISDAGIKAIGKFPTPD